MCDSTMYLTHNYISDYGYSSTLHIPLVNPFTGEALTKTDEEVIARLGDYIYNRRNENADSD